MRVYQKVAREGFLKLRHEQIAAAKEAAGEHDIVVDPGDEVICDYCNDLVEDEFLNVSIDGRTLLCEKCLGNETSVSKKQAAYLGDGLYVDYDGYQVRLYASDGRRTTNQVFLEPGVLLSFVRYLKSIGFEVDFKVGRDR